MSTTVVGSTSRRERLLAQLAEPLPPAGASVGYQLALGLVAVFMLALPLVYVAMIAGVSWLTWWWAVNAAEMLEGSSGKAAALGYITPLVAGSTLVLFMVKPLFARRIKPPAQEKLARNDEPLLFDFVDRLCDVVGSPRPTEIRVDNQVNASAGFRRGIWSLFGSDMVLTIGLPLVHGLNLRQFTGVLAHEFGHFAQGAGMRMTFIIRTTNAWFARLVYERDAWDARLDSFIRGCPYWPLTLVLMFAKGCVWLVRKVLWVLMWLGHAVSCAALRQMEYDADRVGARMVGTTAYYEVDGLMPQLQVASEAAHSRLADAWNDRRLTDNLPRFILARFAEMPPEVRNQVAEATWKARTGWFDTHPSPDDRRRAGLREPAEGVFRVKGPATALFARLDDVARRVTLAFYREALGENLREDQVHRFEAFEEGEKQQQHAVEASKRFFQGLLDWRRPVYPSLGRLPEIEIAAAAEELLAARGQAADVLPRARAAATLWAAYFDIRLGSRLVLMARTAGFKTIKGANLPFDQSNPQLSGKRDIAEIDARTARPDLEAFLAACCRRIDLCRRLDETRTPDGAFASNRPLLEALAALRPAMPQAAELLVEANVLGLLLSQLTGKEPAKGHVEAILTASQGCIVLLEKLHAELKAAANPYDLSDRAVTIWATSAGQIPPEQEVGSVYEVSRAVVDAVSLLYMRILSDLAALTERFEQDLGLPPAEAPANNEGQEPTKSQRAAV